MSNLEFRMYHYVQSPQCDELTEKVHQSNSLD